VVPSNADKDLAAGARSYEISTNVAKEGMNMHINFIPIVSSPWLRNKSFSVTILTVEHTPRLPGRNGCQRWISYEAADPFPWITVKECVFFFNPPQGYLDRGLTELATHLA
jgi:hypothetical protein